MTFIFRLANSKYPITRNCQINYVIRYTTAVGNLFQQSWQAFYSHSFGIILILMPQKKWIYWPIKQAINTSKKAFLTWCSSRQKRLPYDWRKIFQFEDCVFIQKEATTRESF